jgi:hypothetical protein
MLFAKLKYEVSWFYDFSAVSQLLQYVCCFWLAPATGRHHDDLQNILTTNTAQPPPALLSSR